ncbi:hypothetical protein V1505DRAFT_378825 [Lipomyces doorenjongii]
MTDRAISGMEHLKGNIAAGVSLRDDDIKEIDDTYVFEPGIRHTFLSSTLLSDSLQRVLTTLATSS